MGILPLNPFDVSLSALFPSFLSNPFPVCFSGDFEGLKTTTKPTLKTEKRTRQKTKKGARKKEQKTDQKQSTPLQEDRYYQALAWGGLTETDAFAEYSKNNPEEASYTISVLKKEQNPEFKPE